MRRAVALTVLLLAPAGCGTTGADRVDPLPAQDAGTPETTSTQAVPARPALPDEGPLKRLGGQVVRRVQLRDAPDGEPLRTIGTKTDMGGRQILAIVARQGRWYGVLHPSLPNGKAGWIRVDGVRLLREPWEIVVDRSERRLQVRRAGSEVESFPVAVGRPGSPTPIGRFAVTDRLTSKPGSPYGCCILALSGRQTNLPPGWTGGDRLALHGTTTGLVGGAYSSGCVRIREGDLRRLMKRIPVGTRVTVRD